MTVIVGSIYGLESAVGLSLALSTAGRMCLYAVCVLFCSVFTRSIVRKVGDGAVREICLVMAGSSLLLALPVACLQFDASGGVWQLAGNVAWFALFFWCAGIVLCFSAMWLQGD